jgi:hypothetical protein
MQFSPFSYYFLSLWFKYCPHHLDLEHFLHIYSTLRVGNDTYMLLYRMFIVQAYQTSQYVPPRSGIFLGKCSPFSQEITMVK